MPWPLKPFAVSIHHETLITTGDDVSGTGGVPTSDRKPVAVAPVAWLVLFDPPDRMRHANLECCNRLVLHDLHELLSVPRNGLDVVCAARLVAFSTLPIPSGSPSAWVLSLQVGLFALSSRADICRPGGAGYGRPGFPGPRRVLAMSPSFGFGFSVYAPARLRGRVRSGPMILVVGRRAPGSPGVFAAPAPRRPPCRLRA